MGRRGDDGFSLPGEVRARLRAGGDHLRHIREGQELTRSELAEQVMTVTEAFVADVEAGHIRLPAEQTRRWAMALGVRHDDLADALGRLYDPLPFDALWTKAAA